MKNPRLPSYAEVGWTPKFNRELDEYKNGLENKDKRMRNQGINYYKDIAFGVLILGIFPKIGLYILGKKT